MGELVEFPLERRKVQIQNEGVEVEWINPEECTELIHVFTEVPGRCKCGQNEWDALPPLEEGVTFDVTHFGPPSAS